MPNKTFNVRLQVKKDTEDNWNTNNPVLLANELIIVETNDLGDRFKIGDGTSTYSELPFQDGNIRELITNIINGTTALPYVAKSGDSMTGNLNMGSHVITGLGVPVNPTDAVRQQDLETLSDEIDGVISGTTPITLPIASDVKLGGIMIGENIEITEEGVISVDLSSYATGTAVEDSINALDYEDAPVGTQFVTAVSQTDGVISVTRRVLSSVDIPNINMSQVTGLTDALAGAGGVKIVVQSSQPSGQASGDFWYQTT